MTQANIDIGTGPSTGDGDPIRTAFNKVNENFTELYATINQQGITYVNIAGVSSSTGTGATFNITKYANAYAAVINQQGTGYGTGNVITVWGNVIGGTYATNDLSITVANIGNAAIGNIRAIGSSGSPSVPILSVAGRTGAVVLTTNDIVGITSYISQANLNTANSSMKSYVDGQIIAANAGVTTANTTMRAYVDGQIAAANTNVSGGGSSNYSNVNVKAYTETMGFQNFGNVNVAAYVTTANSAIIGYIDLANTIQSAQVGAANLAIIAANLGMKGYVDSVATLSIYGNANVASYLPTYTGDIAANISKAGKTWTFDSYGNITLPGGATLGITATNTAILTAATSNTVDIQSSNRSNKLQIDDTMVSIMTGDSHWHYDLNGKLTLPSGANITSYGAGVTTVFDDNGVIITQQVGVNAFSVTSATGVRAIAGGNIWTFNGNGSLSFPGGEIQTTAFNNTAPIITTLIANASTQNDLIIGINANVNQANLGMKGYVDSVASQSIYGNSNVKSYLTQFDGNIVPSANVTYSLGSITNQWKDLFVSNNTIFIGGVPLSIDAGGNLLVNGNVVQDATSNITLPPGGTITAPINQEFQLQAKDANSVLRNEINLDPNNGTYMSVWSDETTSFSSADWGSGSWNNESGLGAARFTDAQALQDFWTTGIGSIGLPIEASINGGARTPNVFYENNNGETYGVYLGLDAVPPGGQGTTVPITSLVFYYRTQSKINMDVDGGEILLDAQGLDIDLRTTLNLDLRANQNLNLRGLGQYPVRIYTDDTTHKWEFDNTGSLTLPREGKIYGVGDGVAAGDRLGYISWTGNSSGDGSGFNTMRLVPDLQGLEAADQYIIIDPTSGEPGHIHIRAGGTQDNSLAHLFLGGENSHVKISAGANPPVTVLANNNAWTFGTDGNITFPDSTVQTTAWTGSAPEIDITDTNGLTTIYYPTFVENRTTGQIARADTNLTYRTDDNILGVGNIAIGASGNITFPDSTVQTTAWNANTSNTVRFGQVEVGIAGGLETIIYNDGININGSFALTESSIESFTGNISAGNVLVAGTSGKIGFSSGGFVQQATSNATQVTSHFTSGNIQLMSIDLGASAVHTVPFSCNKLTTNDMLVVKHVSGGVTSVYVDAYVVSDGLATIWLRDITGQDTGAFTPMLKYAIVRAPSS